MNHWAEPVELKLFVLCGVLSCGVFFCVVVVLELVNFCRPASPGIVPTSHSIWGGESMFYGVFWFFVRELCFQRCVEGVIIWVRQAGCCDGSLGCGCVAYADGARGRSGDAFAVRTLIGADSEKPEA